MAKTSNNDDKRFTYDDDKIIKEEMDNLIKNGKKEEPKDIGKYVKIDKKKKWIKKEELSNIGKKINENKKVKIQPSTFTEVIPLRWNHLDSDEYANKKAEKTNKIAEKIKKYTEEVINKLEPPKDNKYTILFQPNLIERGQEKLEKLKKIDITKWNKIRKEIHDEMNNEKNNEDSKNIIKIILKKYTSEKYNLEKIDKDENIKENIKNAANKVIPIGGSGDINEKENIKEFLEKNKNTLGIKNEDLNETTDIIFKDTYLSEKKKYFKFGDDFLHIETGRYKIRELVFNYIKKRYDKIKYDKEITDSDDVSRENFYNWLVKKQLAMGENKTLTYNNNISIQLVDNSFGKFDLIISKDNDDKYIKDLFAIDDVLNDYAYITDFPKELNDDKLTITYKKDEKDNNNDKKDNKSLYKHLLESM